MQFDAACGSLSAHGSLSCLLLDLGNDKLYGELDTGYVQHTYPLTNMRLWMYDSSSNLLGVQSLSPATAYGGQDMTQGIAPVTGSVASATFTFHTNDGYDLSQNVPVR